MRTLLSRRSNAFIGNVLSVPVLSLTSDEVQWSTSIGATGLGRLLVANRSTALARSFSCATYYALCGATFGPDNFSDVVLDGADVYLSSITPQYCVEYNPSSCAQASSVGNQYTSSTSWTNNSNAETTYSDNSSITVRGDQLGGFNLSGVVSDGSCETSPLGGGGTVTDGTPVISGIDPSDWQAGTTTQVTITGQYFGTNGPSLGFSPSSGITYNITSYSDTQIIANITVESGTPNEEVAVTVTSNGYGGASFTSGAGNSPNSMPSTATVHAPTKTSQVTVIAWVNRNFPLPTGANTSLQQALRNSTTAQQIVCSGQVVIWTHFGNFNLHNTTDRAYASAWLVQNSANDEPPSTIDPSTFASVATNYRSFNRSGNSPGGHEIGITPNPCKSGIYNYVEAAQPHPDDGMTGTSQSGKTYQIAEGRIGLIGQYVNESVNQIARGSTPWIYSVIEFDPSGKPTTLQAAFPTYYVYINGQLQPSMTSTQTSVSNFSSQTSSTSQITPNQIP